MKKLIALIVVVVAVIVFLKIMRTGSSVSSPDKQKTSKVTGRFLTNDYKFWTYEDIIGFSLPKSASEIHHKKYISTKMKASDIFKDSLSTSYVYCWVVANLPEEDFEVLVEEQGLKEMPNLLKSHPDILQLHEYVSFANWDIKNSTIKNVYFKQSTDYEEYISCTYKTGKVYIKKIITYIKYRDENKKWHYEKVARD